jgi:hypothetical protein
MGARSAQDRGVARAQSLRDRYQRQPCREAELYRETTAQLAERGFPLLTLDTTDTATAQVATLIAGRIAQLAGVPHADPATE